VIALAAMYIYPVKSCRGIELDRAVLTDAGLEHDREWMIVTPQGRFLTQREVPRLALIVPRLARDALWLAAPGLAPLEVPFDAPDEACEVLIWRDRCPARDLGEGAARWLSAFLGRAVRLVRFDPTHRRLSSPQWTGETPALTRFSDGYAMLVLSRASLDDLNARLPVPLPTERFRPNLVLDGLPPYGEDGLRELWIGERVRLRVVKPCTRCVITTTNQQTGLVEGEEPLRTLGTYRWDAALGGATFGQNVIVLAGAGASLSRGTAVHPRGG